MEELEILKKGLDLAAKRGAFNLDESSTLLTSYVKVKQFVQNACHENNCKKEIVTVEEDN